MHMTCKRRPVVDRHNANQGTCLWIGHMCSFQPLIHHQPTTTNHSPSINLLLHHFGDITLLVQAYGAEAESRNQCLAGKINDSLSDACRNCRIFQIPNCLPAVAGSKNTYIDP